MLIDLHVHTATGSSDSKATLDSVLAQAKARGLAGVAITDHDRQWDLGDWPERAQRVGLLLCRGVEASCQEGHFLIFGLPGEVTVEDLRRLGGVREGRPSIARLAPAVTRLGAVVVAAHPRQACFGGGRYDAPVEDGVSAIEVLNGANENEVWEFVAARALAERDGLPMTGGSDAHGAEAVGMYVTAFEEPLPGPDALVPALRGGRYGAAALLPDAGEPTEFHFQVLSLLWAFDREHSRWERLRPGGFAPQARAGAHLFHDPEGDALFLVGGHDENSAYTSDIYRLDFRSLDWWIVAAKGDGPAADRTTAWAFDPKGRALFALTAPHGHYSTLWKVALTDRRWSARELDGPQLPARPYTRLILLSTGALALLPGKALYGERQEVRSWYTIDPESARCQSLPLPDAWTEHSWDSACEAAGEGFLVVGGYHYFGEAGASWRLTAGGAPERLGRGSSRAARRGASLSGCPAELLLFGGRDSHNRFFSDFARWDEGSADWEPVPVRGEGPVPRAYHAACWDQKRRHLWVFGGLSSAEEQGSRVLI
jgi:hypothetical protein